MLKTQDYLDLVERHRKEIEAFPIAYAFDDKQLYRGTLAACLEVATEDYKNNWG